MPSSPASRAPWRCDVPGTFAWRTCTERWPRIVEGIARDVPDAAPALRALRDEIVGGTVTPLAADDPEAPRWRVVLDVVDRPWTALPWYVGESFLYARVRAAVRWHERRVDPFLSAKLREEEGLAPAPAVADEPGSADLDAAVWRALWGNRADLSLPQAMVHRGSDDADLIVDERPGAAALLARAGAVGMLLDNAGAELAADLVLARVLRAAGKRVTLFCKDAPFFVSDALPADIDRLVTRGYDPGAVDVVAHPFMTGPGFLRAADMPPDLVARLAACDVVIAKGDCNYRRLVQDRPFAADDEASFDGVVSFPAPVIALRTLKAEVLVGAAPARVRAARARDPDWLVSGRFGVVQVAAATTSPQKRVDTVAPVS